MTAPPPVDCWVPVPLRWRHVQPGDVFVGHEAQLWMVSGVGPDGARFRADVTRAYCGPTTYYVDPDEVIRVLVPVTERDAVQLCRDELGARLIAGRTV
jgi:hypothetical protein